MTKLISRVVLAVALLLATSSLATARSQSPSPAARVGSPYLAQTGGFIGWLDGLFDGWFDGDNDGGGHDPWQKPPVHVPEPGTLALVGSGLLIVGLFRRRLFSRR